MKDIKPPVADKIETVFVAHNDRRDDEYYWLNQRDNPKVLEYLQAENAYFDTIMSGSKGLEEKLFAELKERIKEDDESLPYRDNGYWYYTRFEKGKQYPVYCRRKDAPQAQEEIMIDQNKMAEGFTYFEVGTLKVSDNNGLLAFTVDSVSRRLYGLQFKNLQTGIIYPEIIPNVSGDDIAWAADNKTVFYVRKDTVTLLNFQVWRHELGTDPKNDVLVYEEKDNRFYLSLARSKSRKYIEIISALNQVSTEYHLLEAARPAGKLTLFQPREDNLQYSIEHYNDKFYVLTDWNAPNYRLMETPEGNTAKNNWREIIPEQKDVYIDGLTVFKDYLVLEEIKEGMNRLHVIDKTKNTGHTITFDEPVYMVRAGENHEFDTRNLRFQYSSLTTPVSFFDYNMETRQRELKKETPVLGGFKKENYSSEGLLVTARDGAKIPLSLVYKKGLKKDSSNPLLLYAYGSYGYNIVPEFNSNIISLLDRGFVYAIAHVRGSQKLGRKWYDDGHLLKKKNTFYDFIDCGEYLVQEKYTSVKHLYANGRSAGGLLMGAITNMRPGLWNGVIAEVPFVDVITTMSDPAIPLTTGEYKEWGNPADSTEYFYMKSYSPYDNVEKKEYPNLLVTTGLHDSQVQYFEPAKWVARLRAMKTDDNVLLFKINMEAGHGGASGRFDSLKDEALVYTFLLLLEGIKE